MRKSILALAFALATTSVASADLISDSFARSLTPRTVSGVRSPVGDTFTAATIGFSDLGGAFLDDGTGMPVFGGISLIGQNAVNAAVAVNIETTEVAGPGAGQSTLTFRIFTDDGLGGTPAFAPAGTTINGDVVGALQFEIGDFNAGLDLVEFTPNPGFIIDSAGVEYFADGTSLIDFPLAIDPVMPGSAGVFSNGMTGLSILAAISVGDGAGGLGNITTFGIDEVIATVTITTIPEPATIALLGLGAVGLIRRRRA